MLIVCLWMPYRQRRGVDVPVCEDDYEPTAPDREARPKPPELEEEPDARPAVMPVSRSSGMPIAFERVRPSIVSTSTIRPRPWLPAQPSRMLPLAAMLSIGLLVGFAVGYASVVRAVPPSMLQSRASEPCAAHEPWGEPYSEQAVAPHQQPATPPKSTPPPVRPEPERPSATLGPGDEQSHSR